MTRRTLALESVKKWDAGTKGRIAEILAEPYMSSEESGEEEGSKVYVIKTIPWESELLKKRKRKLDKRFIKTVSKRSQQRGTLNFAFRPVKGHEFCKSLEIHELKHHEKNLAIEFEGVFKFH